MVEEPNRHKPPCRKFCNRRRKFATGVAFLWLRSCSPDKAPDCPSDERKRDEKKCGCGFRIRTRSLCGFEPGIPAGRALKAGAAVGEGGFAGRHPPPSCLRRGEGRRGGVGRIAGPYGVSHTVLLFTDFNQHHVVFAFSHYPAVAKHASAARCARS